MDDTENKHCWECRRRRLVCDSLKPICNRCRTAGIVCPGFTDKKPLTWITPGKVLSRTWKRKPKPKCRKPKDQRCVQTETRAIPSPCRDLRLHLDDIAEALEYYNTCILPETVSNQLGTNHFLARFTSPDQFPKSTVHTLLSMVLSRRLYQVTSTEDLVWTVVPSPRLYHHRQLAIQTLSRLVEEDTAVPSDELISAVYTFMLAVLQQSITPAWRPHFDAFLELIIRRGGFLKLFQTNPALRLQLFAFWVIGVLANTTTPPNNYIPVLCSDPETLGLALKLFDRILYPYLPCPAQLFAHIVTINQLRCKKESLSNAVIHNDEDGTVAITTDVLEPLPTHIPLTVLRQIRQFSAAEWANSKEDSQRDEWLLVAGIYQASAAVFCLLSLEKALRTECSDSDSDNEETFDALRWKQTSQLMQLIKEGLCNRLVRRSILWPIIVAGAAAVHEGPETQRWIRQTLCALSKEMGSPLPLVAKGVLERFWTSGRRRWDDCFDIPCCFFV